MKITLLHNTPLWVCAKAIRKCWSSEDKSDTETFVDYVGQSDAGDSLYDYVTRCGEKDKELIDRVGNKNKHGSTLEHLNYTFDIDGISRALLQELARHRHASYSVKSSRYTLKELKDEAPFMSVEHNKKGMCVGLPDIDRASKYLVLTGNPLVDASSTLALEGLRGSLCMGISNDIAKYCMPEAYKTTLDMTINARSLQNFLKLRTSPSALKEFQLLANELFNNLPDEHKYLFEHCLNKKDK